MSPTSEPEDNANSVIYERSSDRRRGIERRKGGQVKNKEMRRATDKSETTQPLPENKFIGDFG